MAEKRKMKDAFADLGRADLNRWAGGKIVGRGREYQRDGAVEALARTSGGGLIAWVDGTRRYATLVERDAGGGLFSTCTCPFVGACKQAVAVVLEYLERGTPVPRARADDERLEEFDMDDDEPEVDEEEETPARGRGGGLDSFLAGLSREELARLVRGMAERHPAVRTELEDRKALSPSGGKRGQSPFSGAWDSDGVALPLW